MIFTVVLLVLGQFFVVLGLCTEYCQKGPFLPGPPFVGQKYLARRFGPSLNSLGVFETSPQAQGVSGVSIPYYIPRLA